jgi:type IX secretion system PorP/SprF family membrane protein
MKKKIYRFCLLLTMVLATGMLRGQDVNYTQFTNNPLYFNPAYTGLYTGIRARLSFRDQWPALPYDFKAYHFDADIGSRELPGSGGLGLFLNTDNEGIGFIKNFNLGISVAVRVPFSALAVGQIGIKASWLQKRVNWDDFVFSDALSEKYGNTLESGFIPPAENVRNMPDFGVGGIIQFGNEIGNMTGTIGCAVDHLFEPDQSLLQTARAPLPRKWVGHADFIFAIGSTSGMNQVESGALKINPGAIFQSQGGLNCIQAGLNISKYGINLGLWYKGAFGSYSNSSLAFLAGYGMYISENLDVRFTYNYDMQMYGDLMGTGGAHEVSLILDFDSGGIFGRSSRSSRGMAGGHFEGQTPWECATF